MLRPTLDNADRVAGLGLTRGFGNDWLKFMGFRLRRNFCDQTVASDLVITERTSLIFVSNQN